MDVFSTMQDAFGQGVSAVKGAVSGVAVENLPFMRGFIRLCSDGWQEGWHERNGGNLSYRMTHSEVDSCKSFFYDVPSSWVKMSVQAKNLAGSYFAVTGAGRYMRNVQLDPSFNVGIVEINAAGDSWRLVWGLKDGGMPTSEFGSHFLIHSVRLASEDPTHRILYHAHPDNVIALSKIMPLDARTITRALWKAHTECIMVVPKGIGVVPCMVPGSMELAQATSELMTTYDAVIWAQHGLFATGPDFDATFGLMQTIEKAAKIHGLAVAMNGGSSNFANTITDDDLRAIARSLNLRVNEAFLS